MLNRFGSKHQIAELSLNDGIAGEIAVAGALRFLGDKPAILLTSQRLAAAYASCDSKSFAGSVRKRSWASLQIRLPARWK